MFLFRFQLSIISLIPLHKSLPISFVSSRNLFTNYKHFRLLQLRSSSTSLPFDDIDIKLKLKDMSSDDKDECIINQASNIRELEQKLKDATVRRKVLKTPTYTCQHPVGLKESVDTTVEMIIRQLPVVDPLDGSVPKKPIIFSRSERGGKTSTLMAVFHRLQGAQLGADCVRVMMISFKASSGFTRREGETQKQAILRVIAQQLVEGTKDELDRLVVDAYALDKYIGEKPFVLLVDHINVISPYEPLNNEAAYTLRTMFVRKNRHLVMSTLIPMGIETCAWNIRSYNSIPLPLSTNLMELRAMSSECSTLTPLEVAMHSGISSLIYSVKAQGFDCDKHYRDSGISSAMSQLTSEDAMYLYSDLIEDFATGEAPLEAPYGPQPYLQIHRQAYHFAFSTFDKMYIWPLCYMQRILADMRVEGPIRHAHLALLSLIERLTKLATYSESGDLWELVLQIGILLNCIGGTISSGVSYPLSYPYFDKLHVSGSPEPRYMELPPDIVTLDGAWSYLSDNLSKNREAMFTLVVPTHADFPMYDMFLVYTRGFTTPVAPKWGPSTDGGKLSGYNVFVAGIQARARPGGLSQPIPAFINSGSYIAYGHSHDKASVTPPLPGWVCLSEDEVRQRLLGYSLAPLRYIDWSEA